MAKVKFTKEQSYNIKMAKIANKNAATQARAKGRMAGRAAKNVLKQIGNTVTSNMAAHYANRALENQTRAKTEQAKIAAEVEKARYQDSYAKSLATLNQAITGGGNDSESGSNQSDSTTKVGGSGSKLGG